MKRAVIVVFSACLGAAASTGEVFGAPFTLLKYSDTDFARDIAWWSRFTAYMDPDHLPARPVDATVYLRLPFYMETDAGYDHIWGYVGGTGGPNPHPNLYIDGAERVGGDFSLSLSVDANGHIHSDAFRGYVGSGGDTFSWYPSGNYHFQYEYCDVTWVYGDGDYSDCILGAGGSGVTDGTWSIVDSSPPPPPPSIPLPATSTLLLSGGLLAAWARFLRRGRSGHRG